MARPAPGADRLVALLNFLSSHPGESFGVSELSRRLDLNKATVHSILAALTDAGYLLRHPVTKTYSLGPALIAVGSAAARQFAPVDYAADEMRALADEFGVQCVAAAVVAGEIVMLACAGQPRPFGTSVSAGQRMPLAPPLGTVYMAWAGPDEIDAWLRRLGPDATAAQRARFEAVLNAVRQRGYALGLEAVAKVKLSQALAEAPVTAGGDDRAHLRDIVEGLIDELAHEESVLSDLAGGTAEPISHISAPVFGPDGRVVLALNLIDLPRQLTAEQIDRFASRLVDSARRVTKAIGGQAPEGDAGAIAAARVTKAIGGRAPAADGRREGRSPARSEGMSPARREGRSPRRRAV